MDKKTSYGIVGVLALIAIISSLTVSLPDFVGGLILGIGIATEVVAIYLMAKEIKNSKEK